MTRTRPLKRPLPNSPNAPLTTPNALRLSLLGGAALQLGDDPEATRILLASGKPLALLTYLHCTPARTVSRAQQLELLWSDAEPEKGRHTLRQTFWYLRHKLGFDPFAVAGETVRLSAAIPSDRDNFLAALEADDSEAAVLAYDGDFFPEFAAPGGSAFEQWADVERNRLRSLFLGAAARVVHDRLGTGAARDALAIARRVQERVPEHQQSWRLVLECCVAANDAVGVALELERFERWLRDEDIDADGATAALLKAARRSATLLASPTSGTDDAPRVLESELVGREREFAALLGALEMAKRGDATHLHITALAGHGKTRLLDGFAARLRTIRGRVIRINASPAERSLPFAFAAHLVAELVQLRGASAVSPDTARTLVALAPSSSSYLNVEPDRSSGDEALRRRTVALTELVQSIAHDALLVLLVDDVHWMDAQSRQMLASLATRLQATTVLLVTAARPSTRATTASATLLQLDPLSLDHVGTLVMSLGALPAEHWATTMLTRLHESSRGSPLLVLETLQLVIERGELALEQHTWTSPNPDALIETLGTGRAMQQRIGALPDNAREALLRLSVAGIRLDDATAAQLLPGERHDGLAVLEARGLANHVAGRWEVAHDEIAAQALEMASDSARALANAAMAHVLEQEQSPPLALLVRAASHRARASDVRALDDCFARVVRRARVHGSRQAIRELGHEVLGDGANEADVRRLTARLQWSLRYAPRVWIPVGMVAASLLVAMAGFGFMRTAAAPIATPLWTFDVVDGDSTLLLGLPDIDMSRAPDASLDLVAVGHVVPASLLDSLAIVGQLANGMFVGTGVLTTDATRGVDLVLTDSVGRVTPLLTAPRDQALPLVSPDGMHIAYTSGEFDEELERAKLMVYDVAQRTTRRLTTTEDADFGHAWSSAGTGLAYIVRPSTPGEALLCWTTMDSIERGCRSVGPSHVPLQVVGWRTDDEVLVQAERSDDGQLLLLSASLRDSSVRVLDEGGSFYGADPTGRLVVCVCRVDGFDGEVLSAFSPETPRVRRVPMYRGQPIRRVAASFSVWRRSTEALASVQLVAPREMPLNRLQRVTAIGRDGTGRTRSIPATHWFSLDSNIVRPMGAGYFRTRQPGLARIGVSAGGTLADTVAVIVRANRWTMLWREDWSRPLAERWLSFGDPGPDTRGNALRVNGDRHLFSGVVSRASSDASTGMGVRMPVRLPLTRPAWQMLSIQLSYVASDAQLLEWVDPAHQVQPRSWTTSAIPRSCMFLVPRGEGGQYMEMMSLSSASMPAPMPPWVRTVADGTWQRVTLQVFNDGRCGLAINEQAVAISGGTIQIDRPLRVVIEGQSVGTTVEVGPVEAWTGVRSDIDWSAIELMPDSVGKR